MPPLELNRASALLGENSLITQGAGGNTSLKEIAGNTFYIKASGKKLKNAESENIFTKLALDKALNWLIADEDIFPQDWFLDSNGLRPSIETSMHLAFKDRVVFHTHPVDVISQTLFDDGRENLIKTLAQFNFAYIKYIKPGRQLTQAIKRHPLFGHTQVFILENHGLITCGATISEVLELTLNVIGASSQAPRVVNVFKQPSMDLLPPSLAKSYSWAELPLIHSLSTDPHLIKLFDIPNNVLYPDQAVFFGSNSYHVSDIKEIDEQMKEPCIVVKNQGVLINKENSALIEELLLNHIEVLLRLPIDSNPRFLPQEDVNQLINWEAEKFRKQLNHE